MTYNESLARFNIEDDCGKEVAVELDDAEVRGVLCLVLEDKLGGDLDTWGIAVDEGLIDPECLSTELEKALHDCCYDYALEKLNG